MKNLRPLYEKARRGGSSDIDIYVEGINLLLEDHPSDFLQNLDSIVVSNVGCGACLSFIERYWLSIPAYKMMSESVNDAIEKAAGKKSDTSSQEKLKKVLDQYGDEYLDSIEMYEYYSCGALEENEYNATYYGRNSRGIQNSRLVLGMLERYGDMAIPDLIITAHHIDCINENSDALNELCLLIYEKYFEDYKMMQFMYESVKGIAPDNDNVEDFYFRSPEKVVKSLVERIDQAQTDYLLISEGADGFYLEVTGMEQDALEDYMDAASFKQITHPTDDRAALMERAIDVQGFLEEYLTEAWSDNPYHQKTGEAPAYLMADHDLDIGELPKRDKHKEEEEEDDKKDLSDFKRTSTDDDLSDISAADSDIEDDNDVGVENLADISPKDVKPTGNVTNNYYYNYTNSYNKLTNSNNKSSKDDHSVDAHRTSTRDDHSKDASVKYSQRSDDRSVRYSNREDSSTQYSSRTSRDDHSTTDNHSTSDNSRKSDDHSVSQYARPNKKPMKESVLYETGIRDTKEWKGECRAFYAMFKKDLNKLGDIKDPEPNVVLTIDGVKMSFATSLSSEKDKEKVLKVYAQVPSAIHQYNINKVKFQKDKIGIGKAIVKYVSEHVKGVNKNAKPGDVIRKFKIKPRYFTFALYGNIILTFSSKIKGSEIFAVHVSPELKCKGSSVDDVKVEAYTGDVDTSLDHILEDAGLSSWFEDGEEKSAGDEKDTSKDTAKEEEKPAESGSSTEKKDDSKEDKKGKNFSSGWERFKAGVVDVLKKIFGFLHLKKLLSALEKFDDPDTLQAKMALTYVGTNIPIRLSGAVTEGFDLVGLFDDHRDDIMYWVERGWTLTDSIEGVFTEASDNGLSEDEMMKCLNELVAKHKNVEWVFIKPGVQDEVQELIGPASCLKISPENLKKLQDEEKITTLDSNHDQAKTVIAINPRILVKLKCNNADDMRIIIEHEYGHSQTFSKITDDDWVDYNMRRQLIQGLYTTLPKLGVSIDAEQGLAEINAIYYQFNIERLANEFAKIDPKVLNKVVVGRDAKGTLPGVDSSKVIGYKFPDAITTVAKTKNFDSMDAMWKESQGLVEPLMKANIDLFNAIITDSNARQTITEAINNELKSLKGEGAEKKDAEKKGDEAKPKKESVYLSLHDMMASYFEANDPDDDRPKSDNWVRDTAQDMQVKAGETKQKMKKGVQEVQSAGKAVAKPFQQMGEFFKKFGSNLSTKQETEMKEDIVNPSFRRKAMKFLRDAVIGGSVLQAGLCANWIVVAIWLLGVHSNNKKKMQMRNDIIFELKTELDVMQKKIDDLDSSNDPKDRDTKYKMMRLKGELEKKLHRVAGNMRTTNHAKPLFGQQVV